MSAWTQLKEPGPALLILVLAVSSQVVSGAPLDDLEQQSSEIEYYPVADATGCYYNFEHYDEGDRIITNEPCLNCTCHNRMLMCYLRVCPFTKAIGQDCKVEKKADQCCPVITCPEVPVHLLPSASTTPSTALGHPNEYGCSIDNLFYADGAKVPSNPNNPCEVCYCIRNKTACIIQECTLTGKVVEGCSPVYVDGVCCPVRYDCDHPKLETTPRPLLTTTTTTLPPTSAPTDCIYENEVYADGALVKKDVPCEQCYCMRGDIVCAVQECGPTPLDKVNCTALPAKEGQCCPDTYECENISEKDLTTLTYYEPPTTQPTEIEGSTRSDIEGPAITVEDKEQPSVQTEAQVTESLPEGTEDIHEVQAVTESATVESFTARITEAVDAITSKVTEIIGAFTSAAPEQEATQQPATQTTEPEIPTATKIPPTVDQQTVTVGEIEEGTKPEVVVTEKASQETEPIESEGPKTTAAEPTTESFEVPAHDGHEEDLPHEEDEQENDIEGSGKPTEEEQPIPSATSTPETEDKHTKPIDQVEIQEAQPIEVGSLPTEQTKLEVTEEGSGASEEHTPIAEEQPTTQAGVEIVTGSEDEGLHTSSPLEPESHVKGTEPSQVITEEPTRETTEPSGEKKDITQQPPVTDSEAQETVQPHEPERSTEQAKPEVTAVPEVETTVSGEEKPHHDIIQEPEEEVTEGITSKPEDKLNELVPSIEESQTTVKSEEEVKVSFATEEPVTETEQKETTPIEEQKPEVTEEGKLVTTTEKEELEIITETSVKETEKPESMDHISETVPVTPTEQEPEVTENTIDQVTENDVDVTRTELPISPTQSSTDQAEIYTETSGLEGTTGAPVSTEICGDKGCKTAEDENEIPTAVEEACTKESCKPQEQVPSSETSTDVTVPAVCDSEHGCAPSQDEEVGKIPGESEKETPSGVDCHGEEGCLPAAPGKETESPAIDKVPETQPPICDADSGCVPGETEKEVPEVTPTETPELEKLPTEASTDETAQGVTEPSEVTKEQQEVEGSGEETTESSGHGPTSEVYETTPPARPEDQTAQTEAVEKEPELETTDGEVVGAPTTTRSDLEKETEVTTAPEKISPLPEQTTSQESLPTEAPKEDQTETTQESDLSVSPISPEITEAPETITASTTETQKIEVPHTELPDGGKDLPTESIVQETTDQSDTQTEGVPETTPSVEEITPEVHEPEIVASEGTPATETGTPHGIPQEHELVPAFGTEEDQTTESITQPSQEQEHTESASPAITQVPEVTDQVSVDTETTVSVTEGKAPEGPKTSESTPSDVTEEETTTAVEEGQDTESPLSEGTQGPQEVPAMYVTTEQTSSEGVEGLPHESKAPEEVTTSIASQAPQEVTTGIPSETPESTEQVPSERTPAEVSQETELPIYVTESDIETTPESEEHGIPGEGSCLVDGQTYKNNSHVPPINQCQTTCKCVSSILQCESIPCPPPSDTQCVPIFHSPDACCPVYSCPVPAVTSMPSDSHVMETTTLRELVTGTRVVPSEEITTPGIIAEQVTTVKSEVTSEEEKHPETEVTEQLPVKPTEVPVEGEVTEPSGIQVTTQKEATSESEEPVSEIGTETKETAIPEAQTVTPDQHATTASEGPTEPEEHVPSHDDFENEIIEEPIHPEHCGIDGCAPAESTELPSGEHITSSPGESQPSETEAPREPQVTDQAVTGTEPIEPVEPEATVSSVTEQAQEIPEQTEGLKGDKEGTLPATTESIIPEEPIDVSVTTQPEEEVPEQTEDEGVSGLPGTTESPAQETPVEGVTGPSVTVQPDKEIPEQTEGLKASDEEGTVPGTTESSASAIPSEGQEPSQKVPEQTEIGEEGSLPATTESQGAEVEPAKGETEIPITVQPQEIPEQTELGTTEGAVPEKPIEGETEASVTLRPEGVTQQTESEKEGVQPGITESAVPDKPLKEGPEGIITEQPEEIPEQTEAVVTEGALPGTTEGIVPEIPIEEHTETSATLQPEDQVSEQTESVKASDKDGALSGTTESIPEKPSEGVSEHVTEPSQEVPEQTEIEELPVTTERGGVEEPVKGETEISVTGPPQEEVPEQTEIDKDDGLSTTVSAIPEQSVEEETEVPVTIQPQEQIPEKTESEKEGALPGTTESAIPDSHVKEGEEPSVTKQPEEEIPEQTEGGEEGALPGTTDSIIPEGHVKEGEEPSVTKQPEEKIPEQTQGGEEGALPGTTESTIPEGHVKEGEEPSVTKQPEEEIPEQTEGGEEGALPGTTESIIPEGHVKEGEEPSVTKQPEEEISEQTEGEKEGGLPGTTESIIPEGHVKEGEEASVTKQPEEEIPEQTEGEREGAVPGTTESSIPEGNVKEDEEPSVTKQPEEEIPEQTEGEKEGAVPGITESSIPEGHVKEGEEPSATKQPEEEIPEQTEGEKEGAVPGTTESSIPEGHVKEDEEPSVTKQPEEEIPEQTEGEKEGAVPGTTESVIPEGHVKEGEEPSVTKQPQEEIPEQTEGETEGSVSGTTESMIPEGHVKEGEEPSVTKQPEEEIPEQTEVEKEGPLPGTTESTMPEKAIEPVEGETVQPEKEVPEQTEGPKGDALPGTTESVVPEKPVEAETEVSIIEQTQGETQTEQIPVQSLVTEIPEGTTETASEESSKTPEEIAAAPEMEEAVTTPSVLTVTESVKASEQTTLSVEEEPQVPTEKQPGYVETDQTTAPVEAELTPRPQFEESSEATKDVSTEKLETLRPAEPTESVETTDVAETETSKLESITETHVIDTTPALETEAQVTVKEEKEGEKPKDFTETPVTEVAPETTSKHVLQEATTQVSQTPEEEFVTQRLPTEEQQPGKPTSPESEEPVTEKLATPESEITEATTSKLEEPEVGITEKAVVTEQETEGAEPGISELSTQTPVEKVTESSPVTEPKEDTTGASAVTEEEEPARTTEGLVSKPTEGPAIQESEGVTTERQEPAYTSPQITTQEPLNTTGLYTSGPKVEESTKKYVKGELSTSVPVSTSQPPTVTPTYAPVPAPGHDIPGEHIPELPDYHTPVEDYEDEDQSPLGPGTCRYGGKVYVSAQQIPRDDPCDFCFCFRSDIICLQQSCPPPIPRCHEEPIRGFCCPRYECPVGMATAVNVTTSTTTTTTTLPPHFLSHAYKGRVTKSGCQIKGRAYQVGDVIPSASGPCLQCTCGGDGEMKCDPKACSPEPMLRQMIAAAASRRRR